MICYIHFIIINVFRLQEEHIIGSNNNMELQVEVTNGGEDAFEAKFKLRLEQNLRLVKLKDERSTWIGTKNIEGEEEATANMLCSPPDKNNGWTLECNLGNPMLAGNKVSRLHPPRFFCIDVWRSIFGTCNRRGTFTKALSTIGNWRFC